MPVIQSVETLNLHKISKVVQCCLQINILLNPHKSIKEKSQIVDNISQTISDLIINYMFKYTIFSKKYKIISLKTDFEQLIKDNLNPIIDTVDIV